MRISDHRETSVINDQVSVFVEEFRLKFGQKTSFRPGHWSGRRAAGVDEDAVTEVDEQNRRSHLSSHATPFDIAPDLLGAGAPVRETERPGTW